MKLLLLLLITLLNVELAESFSVPPSVATQQRFTSTATRSPLLLFSSKNEEVKDGLGFDQDDDEWHPSDPASTTPELLSSLWGLIAQGSTMQRGVSVLTVLR